MHVEIPAGATVHFCTENGEQYSVTSNAPPPPNLTNRQKGRSTPVIACLAFLAGAGLVKIPSLVKTVQDTRSSLPAVATAPPVSLPTTRNHDPNLDAAPPSNPFGLKP